MDCQNIDFNNTILSNGTSEHLQCAECKNLLSYFPIYSCDNRNVCGRCILPEKPYFRNRLYEFVAQFLKFPCRYNDQGCEEKNFPSDIPDHEERCPYKKIKCSVVDGFSQCDREVSRLCFLQHLEDEHANTFIKSSGFEVDLTGNNERKHFLKHDNVLFHVETKFDFVNKYFECAIYYMEDETDKVPYPFTLVLENGNRYISVQVITSEFNERHFTDISLEPLRGRLENFPVQAIGRITFGGTSHDVNGKTLENLDSFECSSCLEFMTPPIYQCSSKHVRFCSGCLEQHLSSCKTCTQLLHVIYNSESLESHGLSNIASLLNRFCKNNGKGCLFVGRADELKQHEECCPFKEIECNHYNFKQCAWKGSLENLTSHIEQDHEDKMKECINNSLVLKCDSEQTSFIYQRFFRCFSSFFKLVYLRKNNCLKWTVQTVGKRNVCFFYEIEVVGDMTKKFKCGARCSPLTKREAMYTSNKHTCHMYLDQIEEFMRNGSLAYKLKIFQKKVGKHSTCDHDSNMRCFIGATKVNKSDGL